jgi:D-arabinitol 2-dehydrogenase
MFRSTLLRQVSRASATAVRPPTFAAASITQTTIRTFTKSVSALDKQDGRQLEDEHDIYSTAGEPGATEHEGRHSRTDNTIKFEHPDDESTLPPSKIVQGRGGYHFRRTLASFSLEGRVGVVTGGARGLGLVMSQALILSGANVAIVDLNSKSCARARWQLNCKS